MALGVIRLDILSADGEFVPANVMIDEGSDATLIREDFARRLGLSGPSQKLSVRGTGV